MNKSYVILLSILSSTVLCTGTALEELKIPQGMVIPKLQKKLEMQGRHQVKIKHQEAEENTYPPIRLIEEKKHIKKIEEIRLTTHGELANTTHMAVILKNCGYRLFKKRTRQNEDKWIYWLKDRSGSPLFKVELSWENKAKSIATFQIWSWDDKTRLNTDGRKDLIALFGKISNLKN